MTKISRVIAILLLIAVLLPTQVQAAKPEKEVEIIYYEDGSYLTIETHTYETRASYTKTGSKTATYRNSDREELWEGVLWGSFTYTGSTSTCTSSSCTVTIYDTDWYTISKVATKSGNTAKAELQMGLRFAGFLADTKFATITLSCDANGNLS